MTCDIVTRMKKTVFRKIPARYDMSCQTMYELMQVANNGTDGTYNAIIAAFRLGFRCGHRATKRSAMKYDI